MSTAREHFHLSLITASAVWKSRFVQSCSKINIYHCQVGLYINRHACTLQMCHFFGSPMLINYSAGPDIPMLDEIHVLQNPHHSVTSKCGCCQQQYNTRLKQRGSKPSLFPGLYLFILYMFANMFKVVACKGHIELNKGKNHGMCSHKEAEATVKWEVSTCGSLFPCNSMRGTCWKGCLQSLTWSEGHSVAGVQKHSLIPTL